MKRVLSILLLLALLPAVPVFAEEVPLDAPSAILMHPSGQVLLEKNADERRAPASVTKVMTLLLVMEAIDAGALDWDEIVTGSAHAASMGGSQIWLREGETFTVRDMVKCVAVASANDCSVALAEHLAGSEEAFVERMNRRARELGMENTTFVNACGLEAPGHYTTARDVAFMSCALLRHPDILDFTTIWTDTIRDGAFGLTNTNKLLRTFPGMIGLKTGYTKNAGYCLSGAAERDGMTLVAVVLGGRTSGERNEDVAALLNYGFANYCQASLTPDQPLLPIPVDMGRQETVGVVLGQIEPLLLRRGSLERLEKRVELPDRLDAPVAEGEQVGTFTVLLDGETLQTIPVVAAQPVERLTIMDLWGALLRTLCLQGN